MTHGRDKAGAREGPAVVIERVHSAVERIREAAQQLHDIARRLADSGDAQREELDHVVAEITGAQRQLFGPRPRARRGTGSRQRILAYLQEHLGEEVAGEELAAVSGIQE
jgi:hypothetical protein